MMLAVLIAAGLLGARPAREAAFDLWDWTPPCRDIAAFRVWARDLKSIGVNRVEISAPWNVLEPQRGVYDLRFVTERLAVARSLGMGMRIRINSYYAGAVPKWLECDLWQDPQGHTPMAIPSITDPRFWEAYSALCTRLARECRGQDVLFSPFIGVHAELKWADWWSYDPSTLALWRKSIAAPRPEWLRRVVGDAPLPERPPVPKATAGAPDRDPAAMACIAFREECWREAVRRFVRAVRAGDPGARVSVPLGESFRRQSAQMANLDYWGLSRGAAQVVHSYDFFWHAGEPAWHAAAAVASFRGITGLPVVFEFDGPVLQEKHGYTEDALLRILDEALDAGAGWKAANYSYQERLPSTWSWLTEAGRRAARAAPEKRVADADTTLLFLSKWANYAYREPTEWLHEAQFGAWRMLRDLGVPVRIVCEDNLNEPLHRYRSLYVAFSPLELMPEEDRKRLSALMRRLPSVAEVEGAPSNAPAWLEHARAQPLQPAGARGVLGAPLGWLWLHGQDRQGVAHAAREVVARLREGGRSAKP